jgi:hypothetical protein
MTKEEREVMRMALEAHKKNERHRTVAETRYWCEQYKLLAITAIEKCLANDALEKKAENAREIGLDYEPEISAGPITPEMQAGPTPEQKAQMADAIQKLAQPEQEPVEVFLTDEHQMGFKVGVQSFILDYWPDLQSEVEFMKTQLLTAFARAKAPQRKPLTDEKIDDVYGKANCDYISIQDSYLFARAIEAAHGIKGEAS